MTCIPYTYLIGWKEQNKYYYGVRFAKKCHPSDLWVKYFTSSKHVKEFREIYGEPDIIQIRKTFSNQKSAQIWETRVLQKMNVIGDERFLNKAIGKSMQDYENRKNIMIEKYGVENPSQLHGVSEKISRSLKGKEKTETHKNNLRKPKSSEGKKNIKKARIESIKKDPEKFSLLASDAGKKGKGYLWWNNGKISVKSKTSPGIGWERGRIKVWSSCAPKGHKKEIVICPHCNKEGGKPVMTRFHFDNCNSKISSNKKGHSQ